MKFRYAFALLFLSIGMPLCGNAEDSYLVLSNPAGKEIVAKIVQYQRDYVTIQMKDSGQEIRTEIGMFSEDSQKKIQAWAVDKAVSQSLEFGLSSKRFSSDQESSDSRTWRESKEGYSLRATNHSRHAIKGVSAKYCIVIKREQMGREKASDHSIEHTTGSVDFPEIPADEVVRVDTKEILLMEEKLNGGWVMSRGGQRDAEDELEGIVVEFYYKGELIAKDAKPNNLVNDYSVDGPKWRR